ncbi:MAG TPA: hypothetical protein VGK01_17835 [Candidatus Angelobacter sp.]|jgi:hypothetical protein
MMKQEELAQLHDEARAALKKHPGVVAVAYGLKERGGQVTDELAFRVYVREKCPASQLPAKDLIPASFGGIATDVIRIAGTQLDDCADHSNHDPLTSGINVSTLLAGPQGIGEVGTIGFFATINQGVDPPYNVAFITNHHVVTKANEQGGESVYQPDWSNSAQFGWQIPRRDQAGKWLAGKILKLFPAANFSYKYPNESAPRNYYLDCASVQLDICISSLCHTNCGVSFANYIPGLNLNNSKIQDMARIVQSDIGKPQANVVKVGASTGRCEGRIIAVDAPATDPNGNVIGDNVIEISATGRNCNGTGAMRFSDSGDSGSALINSAGNLVGLLYGHRTDATANGLACHIHPVLQALDVTAITNNNPVHDNPAAVDMAQEIAINVSGRPNMTFHLREQLQRSDVGSRIMTLAQRHRPEVVHLVNNNRRVTVAWRRNQGPAFLNRAMNNARDPEELIPWEIEGVTRIALLNAMAAALSEHGSQELRQVVVRYRNEVLAHAASCDNLHELVDRLNERQLA